MGIRLRPDIKPQRWSKCQRKEKAMKSYQLFWSPEGRVIATVSARSMRSAIRKAPQPYRRYLGEIYAVEVK
jgi:hypothetical protein